jgi:hypothetical protein
MNARLLLLLCACADPDVEVVSDDAIVQVCPPRFELPTQAPGEGGALVMWLQGRGEVDLIDWRPGVRSRLAMDPIAAQVAGRTFAGCTQVTLPYQVRALPVVPAGDGPSFVASPGGWLEISYRSGQPSNLLEVQVSDTAVPDPEPLLETCMHTWECR